MIATTVAEVKVQHTMSIMGRAGDSTVTWNPANADETAFAKSAFQDFLKKGYNAFKMQGTRQGEQIREFDPKAERIIFIAPMAGGDA